MEFHFFFSFDSSKRSFVCFSRNNIIFRLVDTARWEAQNDSGVCAYFLCWKEISFSNKLREFFWLFSRDTKTIYGNTVAVEMVISRWLTVSSSQVNFLTVANWSTVVLSSWLGFSGETFNCHVNKPWKYCTFRTCFPEKPWVEDLKVIWTEPSKFGSAQWNAQHLEKAIKLLCLGKSFLSEENCTSDSFYEKECENLKIGI